jgi:acyl-CoA synthetase (AMP-forming)/AMP-acid ligase II
MIVQSPEGDIEIPNVSLTPYILERAPAWPDKAALIDGLTGRSLSYGALSDQIRAVASGLAARGFRKGDVFAILSPNTLEYAIAFHAVIWLGGIVTTINPLYTIEEIEKQIADSRPRCLMTIPALGERALTAAGRAGVREVYVLGEVPGMISFAELSQAGGTVPPADITPGEDVAALPYSSGTTGVSKGVMLTHRNLVAHATQLEAIEMFGPQDTVVSVLPMFHIYGMTVVLNGALRAGATVVVLPRFELELFLQVLERYRVTFAPVVPPIALAMIKYEGLDRFDLSSLSTMFSGAAPMGPELERACQQRLGCGTLQGWGLTESSPGITIRRRQMDEDKVGSVGPCLPGTELRVVSLEGGETLGPRKEGEIHARGPQIMKGYLNRPDATAATVDHDGWLHTGDIGYYDEDGLVYIVDRLKEMIKYKGFQVAPAELEAVLLTHPAVADAAVIGCPDPEAGEVPKAFVVKKGEVTEKEIVDFVAEHVAPHKRIRRLEFVDSIPKSPAGKILRRILIERERGKTVSGKR